MAEDGEITPVIYFSFVFGLVRRQTCFEALGSIASHSLTRLPFALFHAWDEDVKSAFGSGHFDLLLSLLSFTNFFL